MHHHHHSDYVEVVSKLGPQKPSAKLVTLCVIAMIVGFGAFIVAAFAIDSPRTGWIAFLHNFYFFTGLSAALHLAERGFDVAVVEANTVGWGASGRNGGQAIVGLSSGMVAAERLLGESWARRVWELTLDATRLQRQTIARFDIACDYRPGYVYAAARPRHMAEIDEELALLQRWGYEGAERLDADGIARTPQPWSTQRSENAEHWLSRRPPPRDGTACAGVEREACG